MANPSQRTILFLIADTGAGHRSAANAIRNAMMIISQKEQEEWQARQQMVGQDVSASAFAPPHYRIEIVDVFEEYSRFPLREAMKLYGPTIRYNPGAYGRFFHATNRRSQVRAVEIIASPLVQNGLIELFTTVKPDVIVSIHPMLNHVTISTLKLMGIHIPFLTVVTDLISVHYAWFAPGADAYIVPTEQAKQLYLKRGLDLERVHVLGMPIDPKFTRPTDSKQELQQKFGLEAGLPVILLVGGGEGFGGLQDIVRAISRARLRVQLLIIAGRNKRLYAYLRRTHSNWHVPAVIFGFVHNMPEMMRASDVIITKAGPGTICEALSCDLPIILSGYIPGQEEGNVNYVLENDVGVLARTSPEIVDALRLLVKPGSPRMRRQLENARRVSRPVASFDIAHYILSFLPPVGEPAIWEQSLLRRNKRHGALRMPLRSAAVRRRALRRYRPRMSRPTFLKNPVMRRLSSLRSQRAVYRLTDTKDTE